MQRRCTAGIAGDSTLGCPQLAGVVHGWESMEARPPRCSVCSSASTCLQPIPKCQHQNAGATVTPDPHPALSSLLPPVLLAPTLPPAQATARRLCWGAGTASCRALTLTQLC